MALLISGIRIVAGAGVGLVSIVLISLLIALLIVLTIFVGLVVLIRLIVLISGRIGIIIWLGGLVSAGLLIGGPGLTAIIGSGFVGRASHVGITALVLGVERWPQYEQGRDAGRNNDSQALHARSSTQFPLINRLYPRAA